MSPDKSWLALLTLGMLAVIFSLLPPFSILIMPLFVGVNWTIAGFIYLFAQREVSGGGFLAAFFLGVLGAAGWILMDIGRARAAGQNESDYKSRRYDVNENSYRENRKCRNCQSFEKPECKRKEHLLNAVPCEDFSEKI